MKRIKRWLTSKRLLMAQLHDLQRQLQEAWDKNAMLDGENALLEFANETLIDSAENLVTQLHRVSRERFQERELRLAAEDLRDTYLEQLANEEE